MSLISFNTYSVGERLIEAIMRSDFIFDRSLSNIPFIPLSFLTYTSQNNFNTDQQNCPFSSCSFDYTHISQGFGLPVWVSQQHMLILGEVIEWDKLDNGTESVSILSGGALMAWLMQASPEWQIGSFAYLYRGLGKEALSKEVHGSMAGFIARYRHHSRFHSYWGAVRLAEFDEETLFPYVGFDWYLGKKWSISGVMPWPSVSYGPNEDQLFRLGALFSGETWLTDDNGQLFSNSFDKIDLGFAWERRVQDMLWFELGGGVSGLSKIVVESDADVRFSEDLSSAPFFRIGLNIRPEA